MNGRVTNGIVAVFATTALMFGAAACGEGKKDEPKPTPSAEKSSAAPVKPDSPSPEPMPATAEPNCEGYTQKASDDWSVPQWSNPCRFTNDVFALMSDAGGFEGDDEFGGEVIPVVELQASDGPVDCGGVKLDGQTIFTSMWCGKDAGYVVIFNKSMMDVAEPAVPTSTTADNGVDGEGVARIFGSLLKDYSERRLELGGTYDQFSDGNVACMSGAVMSLLVQKGTFTKEEAGVIGDLTFTNDEDPILRATFDEGLAGTC